MKTQEHIGNQVADSVYRSSACLGVLGMSIMTYSLCVSAPREVKARTDATVLEAVTQDITSYAGVGLVALGGAGMLYSRRLGRLVQEHAEKFTYGPPIAIPLPNDPYPHRKNHPRYDLGLLPEAPVVSQSGTEIYVITLLGEGPHPVRQAPTETNS